MNVYGTKQQYAKTTNTSSTVTNRTYFLIFFLLWSESNFINKIYYKRNLAQIVPKMSAPQNIQPSVKNLKWTVSETKQKLWNKLLFTKNY